MSDFLNKYKSVYNVFLDNWDYQSHYVMFLEKLLYEKIDLLVKHLTSFSTALTAVYLIKIGCL